MSKKTFKSYEELIAKLRDEKQLQIDNEENAIAILKRTSYFALISGYKEPFKNPAAGYKYHRGVRFTDIFLLYHLDIDLRSAFMKSILAIERHLKSLYSYYFTEMFGDDDSAYTDVNNYNYISTNRTGIDKLVSILREASINENYAYIRHYRSKHNNVPLWVLVNALTFGNVSKMYMYAKPKLQSKISMEFEEINEHDLQSLLLHITMFRNVCAHNERLYNYQTTQSIPDLKFHTDIDIPKQNGRFICGKDDLFALYIAISYLLPANEVRYLDKELHASLTSYASVKPWLPVESILSDMGFPYNWLDDQSL